MSKTKRERYHAAVVKEAEKRGFELEQRDRQAIDRLFDGGPVDPASAVSILIKVSSGSSLRREISKHYFVLACNEKYSRV